MPLIRVMVDEQLEGMVPTLREAGYDVVSVKEKYPGKSDWDIALIAKNEDLVFVTEDTRAAGDAMVNGVQVIQIDFSLKTKAVLSALKEMESKVG